MSHNMDELISVLFPKEKKLDSLRDICICPISLERMIDPAIAADGYTYERKCIRDWLSKNDISPMTQLKLPHKRLLPNKNAVKVLQLFK